MILRTNTYGKQIRLYRYYNKMWHITDCDKCSQEMFANMFETGTYKKDQICKKCLRKK